MQDTLADLAALPVAVALLDRHGTIVSVNAAWRRAGAVHPLQCSGHLIGTDYIAQCAVSGREPAGADRFDADHVAASLRAVLKGELEDFELDYTCELPHGRRSFRMVVTSMDAGVPAGAVVSHADITEKEASDLALRQSEGLLQSVIDGIPDPFYVKDLEGRFLLCNEAVAVFARRPPRQMIGGDHFGMFGGEHAPAIARMEFEVIATEAVVSREDLVQTEAGPRTYHTTTAPHRGAGGTVIGVIGISHDISIRKGVEIERDEERRTLRTLIDALPDLIYTKDLEGRFVVTNRATQIRFGDRSHAGMAGRTRESLEPSAASSLAREDDARVLAGHQVLDRVESDVDALGRRQWRLVIKVPLRDPAGEITGLVGIERDITALRADQEALRTLNAGLEARVTERTAEADAARDEAEQANRAKSIFLATMSHEIRTPMNGVIGMLDVLHQTSLKGHQVEMVDLISESAFSLLGIIDDILDFSKMEAGKLSMERLAMPFGEVVEKACAMLDDIAIKRGVRLTVFVDPAIPPRLMGDAGRLRQVLVNLTTNAIKFSGDRAEPGRVSARAVVVDTRPDAVTIELTLTDNGIGMDRETQSRLFQPFTQADATTTRRFGGTGLGLAISNMLVGLMGGSIAVRSRAGEGATFTVRLDLGLPESAVDVSEAAVDAPPGPTDRPQPTEAVAAPAPAAADGGAVPTADRYCVVGAEEPLASDLAASLAGPGRIVRQARDMALAASADDGLMAAGGWTWLLLPDAAEDPSGALPGWRLRLSSGAAPTRFIALGWGKRRHPRVEAPDLVRLDADNLSRRALQEGLDAARSGAVSAMPAHDFQPHASGPALSREDASRRGRLILVAEDNETNRRVIQQQIRLSGHAADVVNNGQEALERWRTGDYALILTDLNMPVMDGYALAQAVRREEALAIDAPGFVRRAHARVPIVAFTANALPQDGERCKAVGMDDYLVKPVRLAHLVATLGRWVGDAPPPDAPSAPLDLAVLKALVGDDPLVTQQILESFLRTARDCQKTLHEAVKQNLPSDAGTALHSLKSAARSVGGAVLGEACAALEIALAQQGANGLAEQLPALDLALGEVCQWTEEWIEQHPPPCRSTP
ncbi:PAS domain-containing protein [Xylophilus sp. Kf1]|nr:PAS domain-containing protein [Xylophilus sp. Kf1]